MKIIEMIVNFLGDDFFIRASIYSSLYPFFCILLVISALDSPAEKEFLILLVSSLSSMLCFCWGG